MANKAHTVAETRNLRAVHYAERIFDCVCSEDVDNGTFGYIEALENEGGVIYKFVKGFKAGCFPVMAHNPEWNEDTSCMTNQRKDKFFIPAGTPFRGFVVKERDEIALSTEGFNGTPEVGKYLTIDSTGKLKVEASKPADTPVMVAKIMRKKQVGSTLVTNVRQYGYARMMYDVKVETLA